VRLNLGCGDRYVEGWHNVDFGYPDRVDERVDLVSRRGELPWTGVTHIYAGHLFEHIWPSQAKRLAERLLDCADPGGCLLMAVGPDVPLAKQMIADQTFDSTYHSLESLIHGAHRWPGDEHRWETSGPLIQSMLRSAGWPVASDVGIGQVSSFWPVADRTPQWQYAIRAWCGSGYRGQSPPVDLGDDPDGDIAGADYPPFP
jgi:hypothetical protein